MKANMMYTLLALVALVLCPYAANADNPDGGTNAADFLRLGIGGAPVAMGEAYVARPGVIEALHYNPAGLGSLEQHQLQFQHNDYLLDINAEYLGGAFVVDERWCIGASGLLIDQGDFTRRTFQAPNGAGTFDAKSSVWSLAAAYSARHDIQFGGAIRYLTEEIDNADRTGWALDLGAQYQHPRTQVVTGAAIRNIGTKIKFDSAEEDLPLELAIGIFYPALDGRLNFALEGAGQLENREFDFKGGIEWWLVKALALRAGYDSRNDLGPGYSAGLGFRYRSIDLDYSWVPFDDISDAHRISLTIGFGGEDDSADQTAEEEGEADAKNSASADTAADPPASDDD